MRSLKSGRGISPFTTFLGSPLADMPLCCINKQINQHHDEVLKPVVTSFPWVSLLYNRADIEPERVDFVAALRRLGVIIVFLRSIPHKSGSNVRYAN